jgi:lipopolysaccharide transport system permease protein
VSLPIPAPPATSASLPLPRAPRRPTSLIRPPTGWTGIGLDELWRFRGLVATFAGRDLKLRYRQTALGVLWFVLQPLIMAATFAFVFGAVAGMPAERVPRLVFTYAGVLAWNLFSYIVTRGSQSMVLNAPLISKVYFPRELLPLSLVLPALVDFAVALVVLVVLAAMNSVAPQAAVLLLPVWIALVCLLACGIALVTSALTVWYRDLQFLVQLAMQLLLYVSPLAYSVESVPPRFRPFVALNPLAPLLEGFRWSLIGDGHLSGRQVLYAVVVSLGSFFIGLVVFRRLERRFADVV